MREIRGIVASFRTTMPLSVVLFVYESDLKDGL